MKERVNIGKSFRMFRSEENDLLPPVLKEIIANMDRQNRAYLNSTFKTNIANRYRIASDKSVKQKLKTIDVYISRYCEKEYIFHESKSTYVVNPHIAAKSTNREIHRLRQEWEDVMKGYRAAKRKGSNQNKKKNFSNVIRMVK